MYVISIHTYMHTHTYTYTYTNTYTQMHTCARCERQLPLADGSEIDCVCERVGRARERDAEREREREGGREAGKECAVQRE